MLLNINCTNYNKSWVVALDWGIGTGVGDRFEIQHSDLTSFLYRIAIRVALLFLRNEISPGEPSSHGEETNTGPSSCLTEIISFIVSQAAQRQWCSVPSCLWNRQAAGLGHEASDLRWCLYHCMLPLCSQRNSRKWGVDELSWEVVRPVMLKHGEIYGSVSNGCQEAS